MDLLTFGSWVRNGGGRHPISADVQENDANEYQQGGAVGGDTTPAIADETLRQNLAMFLPDANHAAPDWQAEIRRTYGGRIGNLDDAPFARWSMGED
jgi:hypothetical protein